MTESNTPSSPDRSETDPTQEVLGGPQGDTTRKDPEEWVTGDEPMTGAQRSYLDTLAREAGEKLSADDQAYLDRAREARNADPKGQGSKKSGGAIRPPAPPLITKRCSPILRGATSRPPRS